MVTMLSDDTKIWHVPGRYVVSFKTRRGRRLYNLEVSADDPVEAGRRAAQLLRELGYEVGDRGLREYGVSKATRVLQKTNFYSAEGVFEEWRTDGGSSGIEQVVERRKLSPEEIKALR